MQFSNLTIEQIRHIHAERHVVVNDAGHVYDDSTGHDVRALDVLVWATEADSIDDDGHRAIERYLVRA